MNKARADRIGQAMQQEIATMLQREVKDPRVGFASVTRVEVSRDLSWAKVFVSILGTTEAQQQGMQGLKSASPFLRGEIARRLSLRHAPQLQFIADTSIDASIRIQEVLHTIKEQSQQDGEPYSEG